MHPGCGGRGITIVSGLPRSGTSLMMQMLEAAGSSIARDDERPADADNPRGYHELAAVKRIRADADFVRELEGRVVKVVAPLLVHLPSGPDYRVLFLERDLEAVLASQATMLARRGGATDADEQAALARAFGKSLERARRWLAERPAIATCFVSHARLLADPLPVALEIASFLEESGAFAEPPDAMRRGERARAMADVVDPTLHRAGRA
ncbi:MAG TPA: sulfotransferase domain-containing protein [Myxococcota bacterium]|nr:sulfotransferase domain-containing protein [Myxococcota bacterium]